MTNCLFFGDSITFGEYDGKLGGWVDILKRYCHTRYSEASKEVTVFNLGIGGETTEGLIQRFEVELNARISPFENVVFLSYGANDLALKEDIPMVKPEKFQSNLEQTIFKAKHITDTIFLINILPISKAVDGITTATGKLRANETILSYNRIIAATAVKNDIGYIDLYAEFLAEKEAFLSKDGIHPNDKGYEFISEIVKPILEKYF